MGYKVRSSPGARPVKEFGHDERQAAFQTLAVSDHVRLANGQFQAPSQCPERTLNGINFCCVLKID